MSLSGTLEWEGCGERDPKTFSLQSSLQHNSFLKIYLSG